MAEELFRQSHAEGDTALLKAVQAELQQYPYFVLWLQGEMGAGKTSFVRAYLYEQGLSENTPVVSPTYTIMNEYQIGHDWYAHLDLYRADENFSLQELGVHDARPYRGLFVEWPEQGGPGEILPATHILRIEPDGSEADGWDRRIYTLIRIQSKK
jgi:tRNA threonylcarbamoyl adenosine modification protein YjeE